MRGNKNDNRGYKGQPGRNPQMQDRSHKLLAIGAKVFLSISHPMRSTSFYICEARVVRQPKHRGEDKYKVVVTGVNVTDPKTPKIFIERLLGMKVVRGFKSLSLNAPAWQQETWQRVEEKEAERMVFRAVNNIRKDIINKQKNSIRFLG